MITLSEYIANNQIETYSPKSRVPLVKKEKSNIQLPLVDDVPNNIPASIASVPSKKHTPKETAKKDPPVVEVKKSKMKKWPADPSTTLTYNELVSPLKAILDKGYRLFRKPDVKEFDYEGYNIGLQEQSIYSSPKSRLTEKLLEQEDKAGNKLIDIVLNIVFCLGIEQGRRATKRNNHSIDQMVQGLELLRDSNKDLRRKVDELELEVSIRKENSNLSDLEVQEKIEIGMEQKRDARIAALKKDLLLDPNKSSFIINAPTKARFRDLVELYNTFTKQTLNFEQWKEILQESGWTYAEWKEKCKKK